MLEKLMDEWVEAVNTFATQPGCQWVSTDFCAAM